MHFLNVSLHEVHLSLLFVRGVKLQVQRFLTFRVILSLQFGTGIGTVAAFGTVNSEALILSIGSVFGSVWYSKKGRFPVLRKVALYELSFRLYDIFHTIIVILLANVLLRFAYAFAGRSGTITEVITRF